MEKLINKIKSNQIKVMIKLITLVMGAVVVQGIIQILH